MDEKIMHEIADLVAKTGTIIVSSIDENGYPNSKAMWPVEKAGINMFFFSTNFSSNRTQQFLKNPKSCLYFLDNSKTAGLMLVGETEVLTDMGIKKKYWHTGDEKYYSKGVTDPDYCILKFTAKKGNYYHALQKFIFDI